ncbi:hypothetical protein CRG98_023728, partial [Punica granatum]
MGACLSKKKTSESGYSGYRSAPGRGGGGGGGGGGNDYNNYQRPYEPVVPKPSAPTATHQHQYVPQKPRSVPSPAAPKPAQRVEPNTILGKPFEDVKSHYSM